MSKQRRSNFGNQSLGLLTREQGINTMARRPFLWPPSAEVRHVRKHDSSFRLVFGCDIWCLVYLRDSYFCDAKNEFKYSTMYTKFSLRIEYLEEESDLRLDDSHGTHPTTWFPFIFFVLLCWLCKLFLSHHVKPT